MRPCHVAEIKTPKGVILNGLWFGPRKPKRAIVWVHGLKSTMFGQVAQGMSDLLAEPNTAVLVFNNRGHDAVSRLSHAKRKSKLAGGTHEIFTECVDDIQGAINFARKQGVKNIFLAGHSTGCQKAVYWASRTKGGRGVKGIILLAPVNDYAGAVKNDENGRLAKAVAHAKKLVRMGMKHELLPSSLALLWSTDDAQRFLSLYTPESVENIFPYDGSTKNVRALKSVKVPILTLWAGKDEYADRPAKKIEAWFAEHLKVGDEIVIIPGVGHSFHGQEKFVAQTIRKWILGRIRPVH